ncbi:hypothetical protein M3Y99_00047600 [Aphelenchoides fujianensis]|nr:hypothetical protein M3Y99_00047600 [Aphelenchoides fujianensis]
MNNPEANRAGAEKEGNNENEENANNKENSTKPPFTVNAVLHFLATRVESLRNGTRPLGDGASGAEGSFPLPVNPFNSARIQFLNGERKGQEELKKDLVRRIKMLEYSLKQERAKLQRVKGEMKVDGGGEAEPVPDDTFAPIEVDATVPSIQSSQIYTKARSLLRQYLEEIGYSEKILDVRSFRVKNLLGLMSEERHEFERRREVTRREKTAQQALDESELAVLDAADAIRSSNRGGKFPNGATERTKKGGLNETIIQQPPAQTNRTASNDEEWNVDQNAINQMKEKYRSEKERKRANSTSSSEASDSDVYAGDKNKKQPEFMDLSAINNPMGMNDIDIKDNFADWRIRFTLRSHMDSVRAMQFHPFEPVLVTASEDGTCKMWNLGEKAVAETAKNQTSQGAIGIADLEPRYTFRGHKGSVLCMNMTSTGDMFFTGGYDGTVCCWEMPAFNIPTYDQYDSRLLTERFRGHTNAVWAVAFHSSSNRVISGSADGTVRLWELGATKGEQVADPQLKIFQPPGDDSRLRSLDLVSTETQQLLTAYSGQYAGILDLETDQRILEFDLKSLDEEVGEINKIISHPTMPVTITAGTDRRIRYFDNNTGKLIRSSVAHVQSISTLAADPNGLYLLSGCDDGSLRLWDMETRGCLQEIAVHRKKYDEAVMAVAFHPSRPLIGSAGADSLVKIFSSQNTRESAGSGSVRVIWTTLGRGQPSSEQLEAFAESLRSTVVSNPHSHHSTAAYTSSLIENTRTRILKFFGASPEEHALIFTANTSQSLKLVGECFDFGTNCEEPTVGSLDQLTNGKSTLLMLRDSHTSVRFLSTQSTGKKAGASGKRSLFVLTAMSNFSGRKYDLSVIRKIKEVLGDHWSVCLDAAAWAAAAPFDLAAAPADFFAFSFYKLFGFPTGIGGLIVRRSSAHLLKKRYIGGGTVEFLSSTSFEHRFKRGIEEEAECRRSKEECMRMATRLFRFLTTRKHSNGRPIAVIYGEGWTEGSEEDRSERQGDIVNFNLLREDGTIVGFIEVEKMCDLFDIQLRTGCMCNQGACSSYLGLTDEDLRRHQELGKVCDDELDSIDGRPWSLSPSGLRWDRNWMVLEDDQLVIGDRFDETNVLRLPLHFEKENAGCSLNDAARCIKNVNSFDCGDRAAKWLQNFDLPLGSRLVRMAEKTEESATSSGNFSNQAEYLLLTTASIRFLAERTGLSEEVVERRFRANFVIQTENDVPFEEDEFEKIHIGSVTGKCTRCQMICVDQETGEKDPNLLLSLRDLRSGKMTFGVYLSQSGGTKREVVVGSFVHVERRQAEESGDE